MIVSNLQMAISELYWFMGTAVMHRRVIDASNTHVQNGRVRR